VVALLDASAGTEPVSSRDAAVARTAEWIAAGRLWMAEGPDGAPLGAIVLGARPPWVAAAQEPERYVEALLGDGGAALLRHAAERARADGAAVLSVACWDDDLVGFYESHGFERSGTFELEDWHGHVLSLRL
jgi:GNAT superfamily N-acetyltransferase